MIESGLAAAAFTAFGLLVLHQRLRREFELTTTVLALTLLCAATPALHVIVLGRTAEAAAFALLAAVLWATARIAAAALRVAALICATALVGVVLPDSATSPTVFGTANGLLSLYPLLYVAMIAAIARAVAHADEAGAVLTALVVWPSVGAPLAATVALFGPALAACIAFARQRPLVVATPIIAMAVLWNYWLMVQYTVGAVPKDAPVSFATMVRQQADMHTREPYVYPFAFPGNVIGAWREGVPLRRYDALTAVPRREQFDLRLDRGADRFLLDGWGPIGLDRAGPFRSVSDEPAEVLVPLQPVASEYQFSLLAATQDDVGGSVTVRVDVNAHTIGTFTLASSVPLEDHVRLSPSDVGRVLRAGYNRVSIVTTGPSRVLVYRLRVSPAA